MSTCAQDGDETQNFTVDVMDYIFHEMFDAMVSRNTLPYAPYIQLLINDTVVAEDLSQYPYVDHKFKKAYVKRKSAAPVAPSAGFLWEMPGLVASPPVVLLLLLLFRRK
jgi:hypothetical protein